MKKFHKKAFSLVELSVILLIISVVLLGVVKGNYLLSKSRLSNAQTLTQNSGILDIPDLVLWLETSLESSFVKSEAQDATNISTWYNNQNISPKNNASQSTLANQPKFYENVFNNAIPAVRFDGNNDFLNFDGSKLSNTNYTIFVVEQRRSNKSNN
jgi:Tfp pilus assembly protein PilE